jgi:hypothetical protein
MLLLKHTLHTTYNTLHTAHTTPHTHTTHTAHYIQHTTHYTTHPLHTLHTTHYTTHTTQTAYYIQHTTHYTTHTLHTTCSTLHTIQHTVHTTHYKLHYTTYCSHYCTYTHTHTLSTPHTQWWASFMIACALAEIWTRKLTRTSQKNCQHAHCNAWRYIGLLATCFHAGILLVLLPPEDGGDMFLRNAGWLSTDYTALYLCVDVHSCRELYDIDSVVSWHDRAAQLDQRSCVCRSAYVAWGTASLCMACEPILASGSETRSLSLHLWVPRKGHRDATVAEANLHHDF